VTAAALNFRHVDGFQAILRPFAEQRHKNVIQLFAGASMAFHVLIVEDDARIAKGLEAQLGRFGHRCTSVDTGFKALMAVAGDAFDAVILDRILPRVDGLGLLRRLRAAGFTLPILMMSALGQPSLAVDMLDAGADDYVAMPVDADELNARVNALVRARHWSKDDSDTLRAGAIVVSPARHRAWRDGRPLELPRTEFRLLTEFVRDAGSVLTRPVLLERLWSDGSEPATNIVDTYVKRLRRKLADGGGDDPIVTVRGVGYMLRG
jgi:two-component system, OmpR family, response regulator